MMKHASPWRAPVAALLALLILVSAQAAPPPPVEGGFTLVVVPDSQNYTWKRPELYTLQAGWIAANVQRYGLAHVLHVGDITQHNNTEQWEAARRAHAIYDGLVPAVYAPGNHDTGPNGNATSRESLFTNYISPAAYRRQSGFGGVYDREPDRTENSYHLFEAGSRQWLVLALEFGPRDDVVRWANEVVERHPQHSVIVLTHAYLTPLGTRFDGKEQPAAPASYPLATSADGFNDGEALWKKLVSRHANIALVVSGHVGIAAHLESRGEHGNTVHQLVVDYQNVENGGNGWLRLLQFLPDGRTVRVRDYTPLLDQTSTSPETAYEFTLDPAPGAGAAAGNVASAPATAAKVAGMSDEEFLDEVQERTFRWFWEATPENGLTPDRWPTRKNSSIAAVGFALSAYPIGVERGWITREQARARTLVTLRHFWEAPQGLETTGRTGHHGFFYHFLDLDTGLRHGLSELSSIDTTLLLGGVLLAQVYFDRDHPDEAAIRTLAGKIYERVDWPYFQPNPPLVTMGWRPERGGFGRAQWSGYDESLLLQVLALGSPTHPLGRETYDRYVSTNRWEEFHGQAHVNFAPLFGHQYSHVWIDFRGIQDDYMRARGIDYFENSRRATLAQRAYAIANPSDWRDYGSNIWGLTASDGPGGFEARIDGTTRKFRAYWARGAAAGDIRDDGTIAPTAAGGSVPFAPEITVPALRAMVDRYGDHLFTRHGFVDAFNPTIREAGIPVSRGRIVPGLGWFNDDYLGIDQGPILLMIENHRTGLIWELMKKSRPMVQGLCRAGYRGGWLEGKCE